MTRRAERVSNLIRQEISKLLQEQINDPRLRSFISVTRVTTTDDLRQSRIYISVLGNSTNKNEALEGFKAATGFLRRELADRLTLRYVPELSFHFDNSIERGTKILELIEQIASDNMEDGH